MQTEQRVQPPLLSPFWRHYMSGLQGKRILVLANHRVILRVADILSCFGCKIVGAQSRKDAIEMIHKIKPKDRPDLIVVEHAFGGNDNTSGVEFLWGAYAQAKGPYSPIPTLMLAPEGYMKGVRKDFLESIGVKHSMIMHAGDRPNQRQLLEAIQGMANDLWPEAPQATSETSVMKLDLTQDKPELVGGGMP